MEKISNEEIDILELLAKAVLIIKKNTVSFIVAFIVGTGVGLAYYQLIPSVYESKMILLSDILTSSYSERITESLNNLQTVEGKKILSARLRLSMEEVEQVVKIDIEDVKSEKNKSEVVESSTFIVTVLVKNNAILPKLQEGIINYLRNNEYVKIRVRQRQILYKTMIEKVGLEIKSLDSLKTKLFNGQAVFSKSSEMLLIDPTSIYSKILDLNRERITLTNQLELVNSIQLVDGFTAFDKPVSPKLSVSLAAGSSLGIFFVIAIIIFKSLRKMVRLSEEKLGEA